MPLPKVMRKLPGGVSAGIEGISETSDLSQPLWAINWFNYRRRWSYETYNWLAAPSIAHQGSRVHFKGTAIEHLEGDPALRREVLLIVNYASARACVDALFNPYFLAISVFREMGLKDFHFGFQHRSDPGPEPRTISAALTASAEGSYLVYHFNGDLRDLAPAATEFQTQCRESGIKLYYLGFNEARLVVEGRRSHLPKPLFMDGTCLIDLPGGASARDVAASAAVTAFRRHTRNDVVSLFKRVM